MLKRTSNDCLVTNDFKTIFEFTSILLLRKFFFGGGNLSFGMTVVVIFVSEHGLIALDLCVCVCDNFRTLFYFLSFQNSLIIHSFFS